MERKAAPPKHLSVRMRMSDSAWLRRLDSGARATLNSRAIGARAEQGYVMIFDSESGRHQSAERVGARSDIEGLVTDPADEVMMMWFSRSFETRGGTGQLHGHQPTLLDQPL